MNESDQDPVYSNIRGVFSVRKSVVDKAIKDGIGKDSHDILRLIYSSMPFTSSYAERRCGNVLLNVTRKNNVVNLFRFDNADHLVTVRCQVCVIPGDECDHCKSSGYFRLRLGDAMKRQVVILSDGEKET